jgi:hypothetical protein
MNQVVVDGLTLAYERVAQVTRSPPSRSSDIDRSGSVGSCTSKSSTTSQPPGSRPPPCARRRDRDRPDATARVGRARDRTSRLAARRGDADGRSDRSRDRHDVTCRVERDALVEERIRRDDSHGREQQRVVVPLRHVGCTPAVPSPPVRLSTTTACRRRSASSDANSRAARSVLLPAPKGTTTRTAFDGHRRESVDAVQPLTAKSEAPASRVNHSRRVHFMRFYLLCLRRAALIIAHAVNGEVSVTQTLP